MISKKVYTILFLLAGIVGICQERTLLKGRVVTGNKGIAAVFVINKSDGIESKTASDGTFSIMAKPGDMLAVYNKDITVRDFLVRTESFKENPYDLSVSYQPYEMDEVVIDKNINSESLGLVAKGQKQYTQQEKKLFTSSYNTPLWVLALGLLGGSMPLDPFINAITGRTKMLKKAVATEKKIAVIEKINGIYTTDEVIGQLNIPADYVQGFIVYAAENKEINDAFAAGDEGHVKILLATLATQYNQLINHE